MQSGMNFHEFAERVRLRNGGSFILETFQMKLDGLANEPQDFLLGFARCDAAGQIRNVSSETLGTLLDDNHVAHWVITPAACFHICEQPWNIDLGLARKSTLPLPLAGEGVWIF